MDELSKYLLTNPHTCPLSESLELMGKEGCDGIFD